MSASQSEGAPQNALSVLLAALPSDVASSIEAGINVVSEELFATVDVSTAYPTTRPTSPPQIDSTFISTSKSEPSGRRTSRYTARPATDPSPSSPTTRPTSQPTWLNTTRPTSHPTSHSTSPSITHRPSTLATLPSTTSTTSHSTTSTTSSTSSPTQSSTLTADTNNQQPPINTQKQAANGTIAGVATGAIAGVVLITLALFFFLRRRSRQKALKAVEEKTSQPYPAVAWLYDPARTPPRSQSPAPGGPNLAGGEAGAAAKRSSLLAPEVVMMPEGEPLLAPGRAATRDSSPGASGGPSRSASPRVEVR